MEGYFFVMCSEIEQLTIYQEMCRKEINEWVTKQRTE